MKNEIHQQLRHIIQRYGRDLVRQPRLCDVYLADLIPNYPDERRYLIKTLQSGIVNQLLPEPDPSKFHDLSKQLARLTGLEVRAAKTIIHYWAYALASDPESLGIAKSIHPQKVVRNSANGLKKIIPLLGVIGLVMGGLGVASLSNSTPVPAMNVPELMSGSKPRLLEQVTIPFQASQPIIAAQSRSIIDSAEPSASPLAQMTMVMTSGTNMAQAALPLDSSKTNTSRDNLTTAKDSSDRMATMPQTQQLNQAALNTLQRFVDHTKQLKQKNRSEQNLTVMWNSTQEPYYQQQQQVMRTHIEYLNRHLESGLQQYQSTIRALCDVVQGDKLLLDTLAGSTLQNVVRQHVSQCEKPLTSREKLTEAVQAIL